MKIKPRENKPIHSRPQITRWHRRQLPSCPFHLPWCPSIFCLIDAMMPVSVAVVCPSAVISHPRIIPYLVPLVITNTTNLKCEDFIVLLLTQTCEVLFTLTFAFSDLLIKFLQIVNALVPLLGEVNLPWCPSKLVENAVVPSF